MTETAKKSAPSIEGFREAAAALRCDVASLRAIAHVECGPNGAFQADGAPVILYEAHIFDRLTKGRFRGKRASGIAGEAGVLSRSSWKPGTYGAASIQHARLAAAAALDRDAALKAASWGLFQILGENHVRAGHATVQAFVNAAYRSADDHLRMLVAFISSDRHLLEALRAHDWAGFARRYNGPGYAKNKYDTRLAAAFKTFSEEA